MAMGKGMKIAIGCLVALLAACVIAAVAMVVAGKGIRNFFGGFGGFAKDAAAIQKLDQTYAYSEPSGGVVPEDRLQAYIAVCAKVKPEVDKLQEFSKSKEGQKTGSWSDAKDALKFTSALIAAMRKGLEEQKMSPKEFHFIGNAMRTASFGSQEGAGQTLDAAQRQAKETMLKNMEQLLTNPSIPQAQRDEIQGQVDQLRQELSQPAAPADPNGTLYLKYKDRLKEVDLKGGEGVAFQGGASS